MSNTDKFCLSIGFINLCFVVEVHNYLDMVSIIVGGALFAKVILFPDGETQS